VCRETDHVMVWFPPKLCHMISVSSCFTVKSTSIRLQLMSRFVASASALRTVAGSTSGKSGHTTNMHARALLHSTPVKAGRSSLSTCSSQERGTQGCKRVISTLGLSTAIRCASMMTWRLVGAIATASTMKTTLQSPLHVTFSYSAS
jgi:hypothetical protein